MRLSNGRGVSFKITLALILWFTATSATKAQVNVLTYHNDNARTGQNTSETVLTLSNVNSGQFGRLYSVPLDGNVYAQPLVLSNVSIPNQGTHNVVYVATENDSLYAIDAVNGSTLWQVNFLNPAAGVTTVSSTDVACDDMVPQIGITGTPVIDPASGTIYFVARTNEQGAFVQRLHAIDVATHAEKFGGPVVIAATVPGTGDASTGSSVSFDPLSENQRAALLLQNGHIIIGWASQCDVTPFHGWIMSYRAGTLAQEAVWNATPNGSDGGIWMAGGGCAGDSSFNTYFPTGNGTYDGSLNWGDTMVKLGPPSSGAFPVLDWFTPYNQGTLNMDDHDLGSGGVVLLPDLPTGSAHQHLLVTGGKQGVLYLVDRDKMGHYCSTCTTGDPQAVQELSSVIGQLFASPSYWNGRVYVGGVGTGLEAFSFNANNSGLLSTSPVSTSPTAFSYPGAQSSISSNGTSSGIAWVLENGSWKSTCCQVLHAYDATNLATELYNSNQLAGSGDVPGGAVKFTVPTVANGRVFVGSQASLSVYGLRASVAATPIFSPPSGTYSTAQMVSISDATAGTTIYYTTNGSTPTVSSPVYSGPISVNTAVTIKAIAVGGGLANSAVASGTYTIGSSSGVVGFGGGFSGQGVTLNGGATYSGTRLRLTDGGTYETRSAFFSTPVNIQSFTTDFSFQLTNPNADGFTFTVQGNSPTSIGTTGENLGYAGIGGSVAVKFDLYNNYGEGVNSTGIYFNGASPTIPATDLTPSGINLHSGHVFKVHMAYGGNTLTMTITDASNSAATFTISWAANIPSTLGSSTAYVGFTASTGGVSAVQDIVSWTFTPSINFTSGFNGTGVTLNGAATYYSTRLRLTNGGTFQAASGFYTSPINVQSFTSDFAFQLTNPNGDGITFTLQGTARTALGTSGQNLGYGGIVKSVAVKFDLFNDAGEGVNSTGLYLNGASPTTPAIDLTPSGVNLHSGDMFKVHLTYDGSALTMTITDAGSSAKTFTTSWVVNIPSTIGSTGAFIGFTGGTAGATATQDIVTWSFTPNTNAPAAPTINFASGFSGAGVTLNGGASYNGNRLRLTDGGANEARSAFFTTPVNIQNFTTDFSFQLTNPNADGFTFAVQAIGPTALGANTQNLGYGGMHSGMAVKFDLFNNAGEGVNSTGIYFNGATPTMPARDLTATGVNLHSGHVFNVHITYSGTTLTMTITDASNSAATFTTSWGANIPSTLGRTTGYVGFTGGTSGQTATQEILTWSLH
jgi:hypothetical protein